MQGSVIGVRKGDSRSLDYSLSPTTSVTQTYSLLPGAMTRNRNVSTCEFLKLNNLLPSRDIPIITP